MLNFNRFWDCPKCMENPHTRTFCNDYPIPREVLIITCNTCGYKEEMATADAPEPVVTEEMAARHLERMKTLKI